MQYKVRAFIGEEGQRGGWRVTEKINEVELTNGSENFQLKISDQKAVTTIQGEGEVILIRKNKTAKLRDRSEGKIEAGDNFWILDQKGGGEFNKGKRSDFSGAGVIVEINNDDQEKKEDIYLRENNFSQAKYSRKFNLILGLVVFILLISATVFGYQKRFVNEQKNKFEEIKKEIDQKKVEIGNVRSINMETALQLVQEAKQILSSSGEAEKKYSSELANMRHEIEEISKSLGEESVDYEIVYDTTLIKEGNEFNKMAIRDNYIYLWSKSLGEIDMVDANLKSTEKVVGDEKIKLWLGIFNNGERWYGYDQNYIYEIKRNNLVEMEIKGIVDIGEMTGWNGLIYVIDNEKKNIMKLSNGEGKIWLKEGLSLSEEAEGISIDSSIWILGKSGNIYHYDRGNKEEFEMSYISSLSNVKSLKTNDKVEFLAYVIDDNTVIIYGKDGKILSKNNFGKIKINDIGINGQNKTILVLTDNGKIYQINVK